MHQNWHRTQSKNWHQLLFKCKGTRQAAHRTAETASRPARAGTSTWNCISSPSADTAAEGRAEGINSTRNSRCCLCPTAHTKSRNLHQLQFKCTGARQAAHRIAETASRPARAGTSTWNYIRSRSSRSKTRRNSRCCSCTRTCSEPKARTGSKCNLNAQEQDNQQLKEGSTEPGGITFSTRWWARELYMWGFP